MGNFWLKLKIWTKVTLFGLLFLYLLLFVISNESNPADVWVSPHKTIKSTTLVVALFAFLAGAVGLLLVRTTIVTARQIRELKERSRTAKLERSVQDMQSKAAMLREKRTAATTDPDPTPRASE